MEVVVFAAPGRTLAHERTFASIEASDIGRNYEVSMHPAGMDKNEHWRRTHELAASAKSEFVLVLEDDVLVNRFILENIASWGWKHNTDFGAGWVYKPGGYCGNRDVWYSGKRPWAMTPGVVYKTSDLPRLIEIAMGVMRTMPWDCAMAWAATDGGRRIRVHAPSLIEHQNDVPSVLGNPSQSPLRTSRGTFEEEWRRPPGHEHGLVDRHGRPYSPNRR